MTTCYEKKRILRAEMTALRRALPLDERQRRSLLAQEHLLRSPYWQRAQSVAAYVGIRNELQTDALLTAAWAEGKRLLLPRCRQDTPGCMDFIACQGREDLRPAYFGLLEPHPDLPAPPPDSPAPDLFIVPALAFDRAGNRLGYGGGYYDRWLERAGQQSVSIGLAFQLQLLEHLPVEAWDIPVHGLCTEQGLLWI